MSEVVMEISTSSLAQAQSRTDHPRLHSVPPEAQVACELDESDYAARNSTSPSMNSVTAAPSGHNQVSGDHLQAILKHNLVESGADYADIFKELQIKPEYHDEVVTGIIHRIRPKRMKNLRSATDAMIKDLSYAFIRGYGKILYQTQADKWLVNDSQLRAAGKERLQFTLGEYSVDGPNAHFYTILEPMWWIMRGIVFGLKPASKKRAHPKKSVDDSDVWQGDVDTEMDDLPHKEKAFAPRGRGRPPKAATERLLKAAPKQAPRIRFEDKQKYVLNHIEQEIESSQQNESSQQQDNMRAHETDEAIQELIARLHEIRCKSNPKVFAQSWETNLGRLDEIDDINELNKPSTANSVQEHDETQEPEPVPEQEMRSMKHRQGVFAASFMGQPWSTTRESPEHTAHNLANEPFNTNGAPSLREQLGLGQAPLIPPMISVYLTTSPPLNPYKDKSYHWPDAPIGVADCERFFDGIDQRVNVQHIQGYVLSYGWNDVMRAIENHDNGKRHGFDMLRQEIGVAARKGVTTWRLKILVAGQAPGYQRKV